MSVEVQTIWRQGKEGRKDGGFEAPTWSCKSKGDKFVFWLFFHLFRVLKAFSNSLIQTNVSSFHDQKKTKEPNNEKSTKKEEEEQEEQRERRRNTKKQNENTRKRKEKKQKTV